MLAPGTRLKGLRQSGRSMWENEDRIEGRAIDDLRGAGNHSGGHSWRHPRPGRGLDHREARVDAWDVIFVKGGCDFRRG